MYLWALRIVPGTQAVGHETSGTEDSRLSHVSLAMTEERLAELLEHLIEEFSSKALDEFKERMNKWSVDLSQQHIHNVIGAIVARQVTLACQIAGSPNIWNDHSAPLFLRTMADTYITLAWLLRDPSDRCRKFIHYGLGQQKLQLEHLKIQIASGELSSNVSEQIELTENWINAQRATFLTDVDLGSWSGISTREMAQEVGCLDFYNFVYTPFSACTHSMWHHVGRFNLRYCRNPLHKHHAVPDVPRSLIDSHYLFLTAKYLQKTFDVFDESIGGKMERQSTFSYVCSELDRLARLGSDEARPDLLSTKSSCVSEDKHD